MSGTCTDVPCKEQSKNRILDQFYVSVHELGDETAETLSYMSYTIAVCVYAMLVLLVVFMCFMLYASGYDPVHIILGGLAVLVLLGIALLIATESSVASARLKTKRIADNATNLLSSQQATDLLNNVATVYNNA